MIDGASVAGTAFEKIVHPAEFPRHSCTWLNTTTDGLLWRDGFFVEQQARV